MKQLPRDQGVARNGCFIYQSSTGISVGHSCFSTTKKKVTMLVAEKLLGHNPRAVTWTNNRCVQQLEEKIKEPSFQPQLRQPNHNQLVYCTGRFCWAIRKLAHAPCFAHVHVCMKPYQRLVWFLSLSSCLSLATVLVQALKCLREDWNCGRNGRNCDSGNSVPPLAPACSDACADYYLCSNETCFPWS